MSWRTIEIKNRAKLDYRMGYLVVRSNETTKIHISEIGTLIVENTGVSLTAALLAELTANKVKVIFCDEKRNPSSELVAFYGAHDTSEKLRSQIKWTDITKGLIWTAIVHEKIVNQAELLWKLGLPGHDSLYKYAEELEYGDPTNREGLAAKVYFNKLFGEGFTRASDSDINKCLNYGYGIILSTFNREIVANGYITQIGLFHDNMFNYFNLGSDLMEPFRPLVDKIVYDMKPKKFEHEEKLKMLELLNQDVVVEDKKQIVNNAIKIYTKSVFDAINANDIACIRFYRNEL